MGCWNETDGATRLPIFRGDPVWVIYVRRKDCWFESSSYGIYEISKIPMVILKGTYVGYGGICEKDRMYGLPEDLHDSYVWRRTFLAADTMQMIWESYVSSSVCSKMLEAEQEAFYQYQERLSRIEDPEHRKLLKEQFHDTSPSYGFAKTCHRFFGADEDLYISYWMRLVVPLIWWCNRTRTYLFSTEPFSGSQECDMKFYKILNEHIRGKISKIEENLKKLGLEEGQ